MQINTTATNQELANAHAALQDAIDAIRRVDVSPTNDAAEILLVERRNLVGFELLMRGLRECGVCAAPKPGAVDWGCVCSMTPEEQARDAANFARIHD